MTQAKRWTRRFVAIPLLLLAAVALVNFIVDPYSVTGYNLLSIPNKFARDDRDEKVNRLMTAPRYDTLLLGSSRVYSINPLTVESYLHGSAYNAGVGTARIEDQLGFLLLLDRIHKFPRTVLLGLDFYTFNPEVETNSYFLRNPELNFLHQTVPSSDTLAKFLSLDALKASYKTLANFLLHPDARPRFNQYGGKQGSEAVLGLPDLNRKEASHFPLEKIDRELKFIKTATYPEISTARMQYLERIIALCKQHHTRLIVFITPLSSDLLAAIGRDPVLSKRLAEFKTMLATRTSYVDFAAPSPVNDDAYYFGNPTHTTFQTGNLILMRLLDGGNPVLPSRFGMPRKTTPSGS